VIAISMPQHRADDDNDDDKDSQPGIPEMLQLLSPFTKVD
jgi:hypothetical protein